MSISKRLISTHGIDANSKTIINVSTPVNGTDATNKDFTTNASNISSGTLPVAQLPALTGGDVTSSSGSGTLTLASVVSAGTYQSVTVDVKGRVTAGSNPTTLAGFGITDAVNTSALGANSGVATLDSNGKLTTGQIPSSLVGGVVYQGVWNASTNTPALASGVGTKGNYYKVSVAGSTTIDGINRWNAGDMIIFNGTVWDSIDSTISEVVSVAGRTGTITLSSGDISGLAASATTDTTNASNIASGTLAVARLPALTGGDVTSSSGSGTLTLASVATAGTYLGVTIDAKGRVTSGTTNIVNLTQCNITSGTFVTSTTASNQTLDTFAVATYRSAEYIMQITSGTSYQTSTISILHDGTTGSILETKVQYTGVLLATFDVSIATGTLTLSVTPVNANTTFKFTKTSIVV